MPYVCDGNSVGVLIFDSLDRLLMITRAKAPSGIAPVAGHVRDNNPEFTHLDAAVVEANEEVGLAIAKEDLEEVYERHLPNRCGATVQAEPAGHQWLVYQTREWSGTIRRAPGEVREFGWYEPAQIQVLAERTIAYAHGKVSESSWQKAPGLEPAWVDILTAIPPVEGDPAKTMVRISDLQGLRAVRALYAASPV